MKNQLAEKILGETQIDRAITDYIHEAFTEISQQAEPRNETMQQLSWMGFLDLVSKSCESLYQANIEVLKDL